MLPQGVCGADCLEALVTRARRRHTNRVDSRARRKTTRNGRSDSIPFSVRAQVRRRDHERCRMCGTSDNLQVHHITYRSQGGSDDPTNLITLCVYHHNNGSGSVHDNKRRWQPVCRAYVWVRYVEGRAPLLRELERELTRDGLLDARSE